MFPESVHLIPKPDRQSKNESIPFKFYIIVPATFFVVLGSQIHIPVVNMWTQYQIRFQQFPNISDVANFSACSETNQSTDMYDQYKSVQQRAASWIAFYNVALHVPAFFSNLLLPSYTDIFGRRFLFMLSSLGLCARCGLMAVVIYFKMSFYYVIGIYALDGLLGTSYAFYSVSYSYIADITRDDNQRVLGLTFIQVVVMATTVLSSFLSGYFIETWNLQYFYTAVIASITGFVGFFLTAFMLPESLKDKNRREKGSVSVMFKRLAEFYFGNNVRELRKCYILLMFSFAFSELSGTVNRASIETLYFLGKPFCWGPKKIGIFQMTRHATQGILGLGSLKLFQIIMSNEAISIVSSLSTMASFLVEAYASSTRMVYLVPVAGVFSFLLSPLIRGIMSTLTPPSKQGTLFAGLAGIQIISSIIAIFGENEVYSATLTMMNGFVFVVMAAFGALDLFLMTTFCLIKPYQSLGNKTVPSEVRRATMVNTEF